jgi:hypothetical protein
MTLTLPFYNATIVRDMSRAAAWLVTFDGQEPLRVSSRAIGRMIRIERDQLVLAFDQVPA